MINAVSWRSRLTRLSLAGLMLLAFFVLYAASNLTAFGQEAENSLLGGYETQTLVWLPYHYLDFPPFEYAEQTAFIGMGLAALIAAWQRRWRDLAIVVVATPVAVYATNLFKSVAGRPHLVISRDVDPSYPSGHFAVAAAVTLALVLVVPRRWLRWCVPVLLAWTAMIGAGVLSMGWHRPSDVIGSALLVTAVFLIVGSLFSETVETVALTQLWSTPVALTIASAIVVVAVASAYKPIAWTVPFLAVAALIATGLVGWAALRLCRTARPCSRCYRAHQREHHSENTSSRKSYSIWFARARLFTAQCSSPPSFSMMSRSRFDPVSRS